METRGLNIVMSGSINMLPDNEDVGILTNEQDINVITDDNVNMITNAARNNNSTVVTPSNINLAVMSEKNGIQVIHTDRSIQVLDQEEALQIISRNNELQVINHDMIVSEDGMQVLSHGGEINVISSAHGAGMNMITAEGLSATTDEEGTLNITLPIDHSASMIVEETSSVDAIKSNINAIRASGINMNGDAPTAESLNSSEMLQVYLQENNQLALMKSDSTFCEVNFNNEMDSSQNLITKDSKPITSKKSDNSPVVREISNKLYNESNSDSEDRVFKCLQCDYETNLKNNFNRHLTKHNPDQEILSCTSCTFTTIYRHSLKRHMFTHPEVKEKQVLKQKDVKIEPKTTYYCKQCKYSTSNQQAYKRHHLKHSSPENKLTKRFVCITCGYVSKYKQHYERHLLKHSGQKTYKCSYCDYATAYIDNHKRHLAKHTKDKNYKCTQCNYSSAYSDNFKRHMIKHSQEQTYSCKNCSYTTAYVENFERHLLKHYKKNKYQCASCKYSTAYRENFRRHALKHTGDKVHSCPYCTYTTVYIDNYRRHVTVHTGEGAQTCDYCNYSTTIKYKFKQHMALHTGEGLINCPYCPYKTPRKYQMKRHITIHTQEGRYSCDICAHSTAYKSAHKKHMAKHGHQVEFTIDDSNEEPETNDPDDPSTSPEMAYTVDTGDNNQLVSDNENTAKQPNTSIRDNANTKQPILSRYLRHTKSRKNTLARVSAGNSTITPSDASSGPISKNEVHMEMNAEDSSLDCSIEVEEEKESNTKGDKSYIPNQIIATDKTIYMSVQNTEANIGQEYILSDKPTCDIENATTNENVVSRPTILANVQDMSLPHGQVINVSASDNFVNVDSQHENPAIAYTVQNLAPKIMSSEQQFISTATQTISAPRAGAIQANLYPGAVYHSSHIVNNDISVNNTQIINTNELVPSSNHPHNLPTHIQQPTYTTISTNGQVLTPGQSFIIATPSHPGALQELAGGHLLTTVNANGQPTHFTLTPLPSHIAAHIAGSNGSTAQTVAFIPQATSTSSTATSGGASMIEMEEEGNSCK